MQIYGIDFTSAPSRKKSIVCAEAYLAADILYIEKCYRFSDFENFMAFLLRSQKWVAGVDFPLGQPRKLVENLQWGKTWAEYINLVGQMTKLEFVETLNQYRHNRIAGDREHLRETDRITGAISPMKVYGVPVGKMFFEGAPRMLAAGFQVMPCHTTDDARTVIEIYPALLAKRLIGRSSYKSDQRQKQTVEMRLLRQEIINQMRSQNGQAHLNFGINLKPKIIDEAINDPSGDTIDAILASIQTALAIRQPNYGIPENCDRIEGWICAS
ncbi:DUF429 domain-containing protein [Pseudanabaena mucicola]|uniref:DUF429 domain-containing protein n=1 Tax=Pseudanabaena mucicola FACHB-723 TaxID=2692860 RepID=A0ABR7ZU47_9CYAN|nr:DUF429 domain-containing protein [Pseudanabaena mucicola]MBD2187319.1 DUF429 domain-containing protein [Pseudanabaena mucicola FACHB-723]